MAISVLSDSDAGAPLLEDNIVEGCLDYEGRPVFRSSSGGWRSARFMMGVEVAERFAYFGIESNLITYLTDQLGQSTVVAAENVNVWSGTTSLLPILGAIVADSYLGRYRTVVIASFAYVVGLGLLTLSAMMLPSSTTSDSPDQFQLIIFFFSIYLVAVAQSGHKPCVMALGADQFDGQDPKESKSKSSFFNWWCFVICLGAFSSRLVLTYIQDNQNWALGFGIPCLIMVLALIVFLLGTTTYRMSVKTDEKNPFLRIFLVFVSAIKNWRTTPPQMVVDEACENLPQQSSEQYKFLNKALLAPEDLNGHRRVCSINDVEDAKACLSTIPIWASSLVYGVVEAQATTFFTKQGATMDRTIIPGFKVPAASLQILISLAIITTLPIYDRVFVPIARSFTGKLSGITMLQRAGTGLFLCALSMAIAALVETKRLDIAEEYGLVDEPNVTLPMTIWWLIPQYVVLGVGEAFTMVGLQEFFYHQVPVELKSVGLALYLSILGLGSFLSSFLITIIDNLTSGGGGISWFADNLNQGHLDYFYWVIAGICGLEFIAFLYFSNSIIYKRIIV